MRLKEIRVRNGYTQDKLATKINVARTTLASWEIGKSEPDIETLKILSNVLNVSIDELLGNEPITYDKVTPLENELIALCRTIPKSKIKEGINYIKYISNRK